MIGSVLCITTLPKYNIIGKYQRVTFNAFRMKKITAYLALAIVISACGYDAKTDKEEQNSVSTKNETPVVLENRTNNTIETPELAGINLEDLDLEFSTDEEVATENKRQKVNKQVSNDPLQALLKLAEEGAENSKGTDETTPLEQMQQLFNMVNQKGKAKDEQMNYWIHLFEKNGMSREEIEKLTNNPDSLKQLILEKNNQMVLHTKEESAVKKYKKRYNTDTKNLEDAINAVWEESGPEATIAKLRQVDAIAGTNNNALIDQLMQNNTVDSASLHHLPEVTPQEKVKIKTITKIAKNIHSEKEAEQILAYIEEEEAKTANQDNKATAKYKATLPRLRTKVSDYQRRLAKKSKAEKKKFYDLNPNLYYGDDVGATYLGHNKKAVFLPLGKLSFADEVITMQHPNNDVKNVQHCLGEPNFTSEGGYFRKGTEKGIYSLGLGGSLTVKFNNNALVNVNGPDLYIFEIGQIEPTDLEISKDGKNWIKVGRIDGGVAQVDIANFVQPDELFYYVRLTDLKKHSELPGADIDAIAAIGAAMRLNLDSKVLFDTGKSELTPDGIAAVKELVNSIAVLKKGRVIVEGHTDDVGSEDTNKKLSMARAKSVSAQLKKLLPSKNFSWHENGLGEEKPLVENTNDENRAKNRRVEILVFPN